MIAQRLPASMSLRLTKLWGSHNACQTRTHCSSGQGIVRPSLSGHRWVYGAPTVSERQPSSLPTHHPPPGTAADRPLGRNDDLRNGAPRRVPTSLQPDTALRRVGLGRSGSVDRAAQASVSRRRLEARCSPTKNPPCSGGFEQSMKPGNRSHPTKASSSLDAECGNRRPSFTTLTCKATRATSSTPLASE